MRVNLNYMPYAFKGIKELTVDIKTHIRGSKCLGYLSYLGCLF